MPLVGLRLPAVALQVMVLLASGLLALSFRVAVSVVDCPDSMVKLEGEINRVVGVSVIATVIVPDEVPLLDWYWSSPPNDVVTVTDVCVVTVGAV